MIEGEKLKATIDNLPQSKTAVAKALGMSKQNLYQLFKSQVLEQETKEKFEKYLGKSIFTEDIDINIIGTVANKKNQAEIPDFMQKYVEQLEKNNAILERSLANMEQRVAAIDRAFAEIDIMKGYMNRFEENQRKIAANLKELGDDQFLFGAIQQGWQEYWAENLPLKKRVEPHVIKETIRKKAASLLAISEEKGKTVFFETGN